MAKKRSSNRSNQCEEAKPKPFTAKKAFSVSKKAKKVLEVVSDCGDRDDDDADDECNAHGSENESEKPVPAKKRVLAREVSEGSSAEDNSSDDERQSNKRRKTKKGVGSRRSDSKKAVSSSVFTTSKKPTQGIKQCDLAPDEDLLNSDLVR